MNDLDHPNKRNTLSSCKRRHPSPNSSSDGSPWQAMKRLRVAEDRVMASASAAAQYLGEHQRMGFPPGEQPHRSSHECQDAGQDTMSEGGGSPIPNSASKILHQSHRNEIAAARSDGVEYHSVNYILGALHLERRQREHISEHERETVAPVQQHRHHQQQSSFPTQSSARESDHVYRTPPSKQARRKISHLPSSSKLG